MNLEQLAAWVGRTEETNDVASEARVAALAATLDHADPPWRAGEFPPLGHWCCFHPRTLQHDLAADGHAYRGGFLPPVPLPRRMWAGGTFSFGAAIPVGAPIRRRSTVASITPKSGRSGDLVFVDVDHEIFADGALAIRERQELVYRELTASPRNSTGDAKGNAGGDAASTGTSTDASATTALPEWRRELHADPVLLFRYSAITFNAHRIHYDRDYCRDAEGYPGLVVHGPLTATLLMDLFLRHHRGARVASFRFRALRPLFDTHPFTLCGASRRGGADLWALDNAGRVAMSAALEASP